jgi:hypothetical protein
MDGMQLRDGGTNLPHDVSLPHDVRMKRSQEENFLMGEISRTWGV